MIEIGAVVALGVKFTRSHVTAIGRAIERDQLVFVGGLLTDDRVVVFVQGIVLEPQLTVHLASLMEGVLRIHRSLDGAVINLLEVGFPSGDFRWGNVEGHRIVGEAKRIQVSLEARGQAEDLGAAGDQVPELGHGGAVDLLDAFVGDIDIRQHGVGADPVQIGSLEGAGRPFVHTPMARFAGARVHLGLMEMGPAVFLAILVVVAGGEIEDGLPSAGQRGSGGGEFPFILVIDFHRLAEDGDGLRLRHPVERRAGQQLVITSN